MTDEAFAATIASSKNHPRSGSFFKGPACGTACECEVGPLLFFMRHLGGGGDLRGHQKVRGSLWAGAVYSEIYRSTGPSALTHN